MAKTDHKIVITNATELKPGAKYLIALDRDSCTQEDASLLLKGLQGMGIENALAIFTVGDPNKALQIVEQHEPVGDLQDKR